MLRQVPRLTSRAFSTRHIVCPAVTKIVPKVVGEPVPLWFKGVVVAEALIVGSTILGYNPRKGFQSFGGGSGGRTVTALT